MSTFLELLGDVNTLHWLHPVKICETGVGILKIRKTPSGKCILRDFFWAFSKPLNPKPKILLRSLICVAELSASFSNALRFFLIDFKLLE